MSYTPTEWKNGDVITAEKLNKLEEGVQAVSRGELITVFDGSITTTSSGDMIMGSFIPTISIEGDSVLVTFENVTYELPKVVSPFGTVYGEFDNNGTPILTNYPCAIAINNDTYYLFTSEANTYEVEIKIENNHSSEFFVINVNIDGSEVTLDKTESEVLYAINNKKIIFIKDNNKNICINKVGHYDTMGGRYHQLNGLSWETEINADELKILSYTLNISPRFEASIIQKEITLSMTSNG